jgi:hypothetical protein
MRANPQLHNHHKHNGYLETARTSMRLAEDRMAVNANKHRRDVSYNVGDMVYISTKTVTAGTEIVKFKVRWIGPYAILKKRNPVAYKINIPYEMVANNVFPVYHVSKLKLANTCKRRRSFRSWSWSSCYWSCAAEVYSLIMTRNRLGVLITTERFKLSQSLSYDFLAHNGCEPSCRWSTRVGSYTLRLCALACTGRCRSYLEHNNRT